MEFSGAFCVVYRLVRLKIESERKFGDGDGDGAGEQSDGCQDL